MGFSVENGYTPETVEAIMLSVMNNVNTQFGLSYTEATFLGTNFYKYFYALVQKLQENEVKTAEIFLKLQQYFTLTNAKIVRPVVTNPGLIARFLEEGYIASVKPMIDADAGKVHICVDVDDGDVGYPAVKLAVCNLVKDCTAAGVVSQGTEVETIVLTNGQPFDFKFFLPDRTEPLLRLTITTSENNQVAIKTPEQTKAALLANIAARYQLGRNFEPQRYFSVTDAPWASIVKLEYSLNGGVDWTDEVYEAEFDDLFECKLANLTLIEV